MRKKLLIIFNNFKFLIFIIFLINIYLRLYYVLYGYIANEEGIVLYNSKLVRMGLVPFIDYNAWNSLLNDYINSLPGLLFPSSILILRIYSFLIALLVFYLTLKIAYRIGKKSLCLLTAVFLGFGCPIYMYYSNTPYSEQRMTFLTVLALFLIIRTNSMIQKVRTFIFDLTGLFILAVSVVLRIQALPLLILVYLFIVTYRPYKLVQKIGLTFTVIVSLILIYLPFILKSWQHIVYAVIWPFFSSKITLYTHGNRLTITQLMDFLITASRDYGIYLVLIIYGTAVYFKTLIQKNERSGYNLLITIISLFYVVTALIHTPADSYYIYPAVPFLSLLAAYWVNKELSISKNKFILVLICFWLLVNFITFPHFKFIKTSLASIRQTPHDYINTIATLLLNQTTKDEKILTFYLPVVAQIDRQVPLTMNEGPASISILSDSEAEKWHLTTINQLQNMIRQKSVKLIVLTDNSSYYFGGNDNEKNNTIDLIKKNYRLIQQFPHISDANGTKANFLSVYSRLPE